jgi:hypothetical protein
MAMRRPSAALGLALAALAGSAGPSPAATARPHIAEFTHALSGGATAAAAVHRSGVLRPGRRFDLVGLRWRGRVDARDVRAQVRVRGRWGRWFPLASADDHGPDGAVATHGTDPAWTGGADAIRLTWRGSPRHLRLHFVRVTHRPHPRPLARAAQEGGPPPILPRSAWDPFNQCPPRTTPEYGTVDMAFVHHTVTANDYGPGDSAAMILAICRYHRNGNGWNDVGYNVLVDKYGQLFEGRAGGIDQPIVGAQAQGWNSVSTSVSNLGTYSSVPASQAAIDALADLLARKHTWHGVPVIGTVTLTSPGGSLNRWPAGQNVTFQRISGHRDGGKTSCPGGALYAQLPGLRDLAASRVDQYAAAQPAPGAGSVTMTAVTRTLFYPEPAQLSGKLTGGGRVSIQVQSAGSYVTIARADPAPDGSWSAQLPLNTGHVLRALQVLPDGQPGAVSQPISVTVSPALSASAPSRILAGRRVVLRGTIGPQRRVLSLSLARESGGRLVTVAQRRLLASRGAFRSTVLLSRPGLYRLHVRFAGDLGTRPASSDVYVRAVRHASSLHRRRQSVNGGAEGPQG